MRQRKNTRAVSVSGLSETALARHGHLLELEMPGLIDEREPRRVRVGGARIREQDKDIIVVVRPVAEIIRTTAAGCLQEIRNRWRGAVLDVDEAAVRVAHMQDVLAFHRER